MLSKEKQQSSYHIPTQREVVLKHVPGSTSPVQPPHCCPTTSSSPCSALVFLGEGKIQPMLEWLALPGHGAARLGRAVVGPIHLFLYMYMNGPKIRVLVDREGGHLASI